MKVRNASRVGTLCGVVNFDTSLSRDPGFHERFSVRCRAEALNTVIRLDGLSQLNQYFQGISSYTPGTEAIETVSIVTSSMGADQGLAGAASANVQIKSGTKPTARIGVRSHHRLRLEGQEFLPAATRSEGDREHADLRRHRRRPYQEEQAVLLWLRGKDAAAGLCGRPAVEYRLERSGQPAQLGDAHRRFQRHRHDSLRPGHLNFVERYRTHSIRE